MLSITNKDLDDSIKYQISRFQVRILWIDCLLMKVSFLHSTGFRKVKAGRLFEHLRYNIICRDEISI